MMKYIDINPLSAANIPLTHAIKEHINMPQLGSSAAKYSRLLSHGNDIYSVMNTLLASYALVTRCCDEIYRYKPTFSG